MGKYDEAVVDYTEAIGLDAENALLHNNRGYGYISLGEYQKAIDDFNEAVRLDPEYMEAFGGRARAHALLGKDGRAEEDIARAEELGANRASLEQDIELLKAGVQVLFD